MSNIDFATVMIVLLGSFTVFFAAAFVRSLLRERRAEILNRISEVEDQYWREHEKMWQRINLIERVCREDDCCKGKEYPVKNHYNTGA